MMRLTQRTVHDDEEEDDDDAAAAASPTCVGSPERPRSDPNKTSWSEVDLDAKNPNSNLGDDFQGLSSASQCKCFTHSQATPTVRIGSCVPANDAWDGALPRLAFEHFHDVLVEVPDGHARIRGAQVKTDHKRTALAAVVAAAATAVTTLLGVVARPHIGDEIC
jgi:hypothetical protein